MCLVLVEYVWLHTCQCAQVKPAIITHTQGHLLQGNMENQPVLIMEKNHKHDYFGQY